MPGPDAGEKDGLRAVASVTEGLVDFPETVFMLGASLGEASEQIRDLDAKKRLGLGNVLDATPPVWVHLDGFSIMSRMVTNGEYLEFLSYEDEEGRLYDAAELWRHVWSELGFHVTTVQMPFRDTDGQVRFFEETYSACTSFVEAYLHSLHNEMQCVFLSTPEEREPRPSHEAMLDDERPARTQAKSASRDHRLRRVFALAKSKLRRACAAEDSDGSETLTDEDRRLLAEYRGEQTAASSVRRGAEPDLTAALDDIGEVCRELKRGYGRQVDPRLLQAFRKGLVPVEPIQFLERLAGAMRASGGGVEEPVALSQVLFPRSWRSPAGMHKRRRFIGSAVPWEDCPVFGITFFEAVAYAAWLSAVTGKPVTLPDEAQYERAASWPVTAPPGRGGKAGRSSRQAAAKPLLLDPGRKLLFPWQDHCPHDFNHFFGREGRGVEDYYQKDRELYARLLRSTSRRLGAKGAPGGEGEEGGAVEIHQLEGFGWHWTRDRYNETERKYSRFEDPDYPLFTAAPCATSDGTRVKVRHYVANRSPRDPLFVLKGSPDVVGGPGTTTRRYAVYPLRGYTNVGFRLVCQKK